jgi:DNA-binding response OmpR family regulator
MKQHILLVEDDTKARSMLAYLLQHSGYQVTQAASGETALDLLERESFMVVLTDIVMGDVDGIEVLYTARLQSYRPAVILLTGHGTLESCQAALRAGAYDYLLKPCTDDELLTCVARAVEHQQTEQRLREAASLITTLYQADTDRIKRPADGADNAPPVRKIFTPLRIGALTIGASRKDVTLDGCPVHVTPIEYTLLCCLAETPGSVRTYSDIVRSTHGLETDEAEAQILLRVHISNLRKKLSPAYIVNNRGTGYMLVNPTP